MPKSIIGKFKSIIGASLARSGSLGEQLLPVAPPTVLYEPKSALYGI